MSDRQSELYRKAIENAGNWLADSRTIILDTETTGLNGYLVEIAAIDPQGNVLLNTLINPPTPDRPEGAGDSRSQPGVGGIGTDI